MSKHYLLSPSGSSRWLQCPGSLELCKGEPDQESEFAKEGTLAHELAERCLNSGIDADDTDNEDYPDDMHPHVQVYLDHVRGLAKVMKDCVWRPEQIIESKEIEDFGGTVDWCGYYKDSGKNVLHVVDLKYGAGIAVSVEGNPQLMCYLLLAREMTKDDVDAFRATIVQPRIEGEIETVEYSPEDMDLFKARITDSVGQSHLASGDHCRWCKAVAKCPKLYEEATEAAAIDFDDGSEDLHEQWVLLMQAATRIRRVLDEVPKRMVEEMRKGVVFHGCKAVAVKGNRSWEPDPEAVIKKLQGRGIKKSVSAPPTLLSPTKLAKLGFEDKTTDLVIRKDMGFRAVLDTAKGKAVTFEPEAEFDVIEEFDFLN